MSVMLHLVSPLSAGLFHGAIMESSPSAFQYQDYVAQKLTYGDKFVSYANCSVDPASSKKNDPAAVMRCLRAMPAKEAFDVGEKAASDATAGLFDRILEGGRLEDALAMEWAPVVDFDLAGNKKDDLQMPAGKFHKVPLLVGTNQDEAATFIYAGLNKKVPEAVFGPLMKVIFGEADGEKVVKFYSKMEPQWNDMRDSFSQVLTDYWFKCSSAKVAGLLAKAGVETYMYRFSHLSSFHQVYAGFLPDICQSRVCHGTEMAFVFHATLPNNVTFTEPELAMSKQMARYWTNFIGTGNPNTPLGAGIEVVGSAAAAESVGVQWPQFNVSTRVNIRLDLPIVVESTKDGSAAPPAGVCNFFDSEVGYNH
eukprot:gene9584-3143_t